jgi:hypothetical protein
LDSISDLSQKVLIVEGGLADCYGNGQNGTIEAPYYSVFSGYNINGVQYDGYDFGKDMPGNCVSTISSNNPAFHKLSYVHDNYQEFWICDNGNMPNVSWGRTDQREFANKFNIHFAGKAYMIPSTHSTNGNDRVYTTVSFFDPLKGDAFKEFVKLNPSGGGTWGSFVSYLDEPNDFNYLVGNMNVLFGDNSVATKDQGWLSINRIQIAAPINK